MSEGGEGGISIIKRTTHNGTLMANEFQRREREKEPAREKACGGECTGIPTAFAFLFISIMTCNGIEN